MAVTNVEVFRKYTSADVWEKLRLYDSVTEMWENSVKEFADSVAIADDGKEYTYQKLDEDGRDRLMKYMRKLNEANKE